MASFIDVSGEQLVRLLTGEQITVSLDRLEVLVSLYYSAISDFYIGVDSHLPSRFLQVHPFLLDNLAENKSSPLSPQGGEQTHTECYAPHRVRIVPHDIETLRKDLTDTGGEQAHEYFEQNKKHGVLLLQVDESDLPGIPAGEWTGDLGLWVNTCALLFEPSIKPENRQLRLEQLYPGDERFRKYIRYVTRLIERAKVVDYRGDTVNAIALPEVTKNHLLWSLDAMFEPGLADVWDEFVNAPKRIRNLGPFINRQIKTMGLDSVKVFDAATGTGAESIYLVEKGHAVTSNEIEPRLIAHAQEAAEAAGIQLSLCRFDWRHLEHLGPPEQYDLVLALGNSLSCLPSAAAVRTVLTRFAYLLRPNGRLIIDERNYPLIYSKKREMSRNTFRFPPNVVYCSTTIQARPAYIPPESNEGELLILEYVRSDGSSVGTFKVLPFRDGELIDLLSETGFGTVEQYYNLRVPNGNREESEFITYVARRSFVESGLGAGKEFEAVIAFSDVSRSTPLKKELGAERYGVEWAHHDTRVRKVVAGHNGRIVNSTGDGFLITFPNSRAAVACMHKIVNDPGTSVLVVRAGISKGRVVEDDHGNIRGREVDAAARICDAARPDRLVVDDRVRIDVTDYDWTSLGTDLKGVGSRQLWELTD